MANFGPSKTWTDGEILSHTDLNAALLDIINNVTNNNIDADNIDETDDYTWSGANSFVGGHSIKVLSNAAASIVTGTTLEWDPGDGGQMTDNSSGISLDFKLPDAADNQDTFASIAAICLDDTSTSEDGELSFRVATAGTNTEQMTLSSTALTVTPAITASGGITSGGNIVSDTDSTDDLGTTGVRWANLFVDDVTVTNNVTIGGTLTLTGGITLNGNTTIGDSSADTLTVNSTITSNLIFTDNTYDIGASGATRPRDLFLSRNAVMGGTLGVTGATTLSSTLGVTGLITASGGVSGTTGTFSGDLAVDTDTLFVDASADRVGVNNAAPSTPLHVKDASTAYVMAETTGTSTSAGFRLKGDASADYTIYTTQGVGNFGIYDNANAAQRLTIDTSGNMGLGVTPSGYFADKFVVSAGNADGITIAASATSDTNYLLFADGTSGNAAYRGQIVYDHANDLMQLATAATAALTIDSSQRVGIGTASPSAPLSVASTASTYEGMELVTPSGDASGVFQFGVHDSGGISGRNIEFRRGGSDGFDTLSLRITDAGRVGINTTDTKNAMLYVEQDSASTAGGIQIGRYGGDAAWAISNVSSNLRFGVDNTADGTIDIDAMTIDYQGLVGIGTISPTSGYSLDIANSSSANVYIRTTASSDTASSLAIEGYRSNGSAGYLSRIEAKNRNGAVAVTQIDSETESVYNSGALVFKTASTGTMAERARIDANGDVAIGRAPYTNYRFTVQSADSSSSTYALQIQNSLGYGLIQARSDGQITTGNYTLSPYNNTTASAANMHVTSSGILQRSTSSAKYKTGVETIEDSYADAILNMRPVWYRSLSEADNANHGWWGFIAEEVAEIDPRLVQYRTTESVISEESGREETVTLDEPIPEGVSYDRFVPLLLNLIQRQQQSIATLETKVAALEAA